MLTDQNKQIILATVPLLKEGGVALTKHFYKRMFTHHPELKNLFNMGNQHSGNNKQLSNGGFGLCRKYCKSRSINACYRYDWAQT